MVERYNGFPAAKIVGSAAPGHASGEAIAAMEQTLCPGSFPTSTASSGVGAS